MSPLSPLSPVISTDVGKLVFEWSMDAFTHGTSVKTTQYVRLSLRIENALVDFNVI
jgi:hypothetical protein